MPKLKEGDLILFDEVPEGVTFPSIGQVLGITHQSEGSGLWIIVGIVPKLGTSDSAAREIVFFDGDEESEKGISSWDATGSWKVDLVFRPD